MASSLGPVAASLDSVPLRKERLQKAFVDLESQTAILSSFTNEWKELEEHFSNVEKSVQKRLDELLEKEKAIELKAQESEEALKKREDAISSREKASLNRVQQQKDSAISAIFDEKRKWQEEKERHEPCPGVDKEESLDAKLTHDGSLNQENADLAPTQAVAVQEVKKQDNVSTPSKPVASDAKAFAELRLFCEDMDGTALMKVIKNRRKDIGALQSELPGALQYAIDPARLVLDALEDYPLEECSKGESDKKDSVSSGASPTRRACILLLEALAVTLADPVLGEDHPLVPSNTKEKAKAIAEKWKSKMDIFGGSPSESFLDAQAFLQLLATFGIASDYAQDDLCRLITIVARRRQSPALCRALGLTPKIPDVVERLSKEGKQLEALSFAHSFDIMEKVQPVALLKAFLKDARKSAQMILKAGNGSPWAQNDAGIKELSALKAVLKSIEEYNLEAQYPAAPLQRRVEQLEKAKSDRKRAAGAVKAHAKRPKANAGSATGYTGPVVSDRLPYRHSDRTQHSGPGLPYTLTSKSGYDGRVQVGYPTPYGGASRTSVPVSGAQLYSVDGIGSNVYGSALYATPSAAYSGYQFGSGLPPPPPAYQASFLH